MKTKSKIQVSNDIVIRPRFQMELDVPNEDALNAFQAISKSQSNFIVSRVDDHVFIKFPKAKQTLWTPQLHLEINELTPHSSKLYGLFGPNPTLWLLFIFLHLILAVVALGFGIWLYSNWSLGVSFFMQATVLSVVLCIWVLLYVFGRLGRAEVKPEMIQLKAFMDSVLDSF